MCYDRKDIPQRRVKRWSFNVRELLKDAAGREHFRRFLEKEFSAENLKLVMQLSIITYTSCWMYKATAVLPLKVGGALQWFTDVHVASDRQRSTSLAAALRPSWRVVCSSFTMFNSWWHMSYEYARHGQQHQLSLIVKCDVIVSLSYTGMLPPQLHVLLE